VTVVALIPVLMIVLGALVYALASNPKVAELGRLCAMAGLFAFAFGWAGHVVTLGH